MSSTRSADGCPGACVIGSPGSSGGGVPYNSARLGWTLGRLLPRWQVLHVTTCRPPKLVRLSAATICIMRRAVRFFGLSSAYFAQSPPLSSTWQSVQFRPRDAEKNPIVPMNSSTGMPLRIWTFLKTSSAIGGSAPAAA